ncbi:MAG: hypothetical protein LBS97_03560 [Treponema sp.]|jgi:hypothetical protein|nr:hypothetical protein [Treponema sp.]
MKKTYSMYVLVMLAKVTIVALALAFGLVFVGCDDGSDDSSGSGGKPNGEGGVTVAADGKLKIDSDIWTLDEATHTLVKATSVTGKTVTASIQTSSEAEPIPVGTGTITAGKLSITISKPDTTKLPTLKEQMEEQGSADAVKSGGNIQFGSVSISIDDGGLELIGNPKVESELYEGQTYYYVDYSESFSYSYASGAAKVEGTLSGTPDDYDGWTGKQILNITVQEGWNSFSVVSSQNEAAKTYSYTIASKNPSSSAKWIYEGWGMSIHGGDN